MPRSDAFKQGQKNRPKLDPYSAVAKVGVAEEPEENDLNDLEAEAGVEDVVPMPPSPQPKPEPLPPWLQHFKKIPISQIRPGVYQKRLPEARKRNQEKDAQLEMQMRFSHERGHLHLDVAVMPDPDDSGFYNPSQGMHRRIEIARKIGITELLCYVQKYDRDALAQGTYFENSDFARLGLNIIEEGLIFQQAMEDNPRFTQEDVAEFFKLPNLGGREHVKVCLGAARAMPDVQELVYHDPERATRVIGKLSLMDGLDNCVAKRAPIIQGFLEKRLTADQVDLAVEAVRQ